MVDSSFGSAGEQVVIEEKLVGEEVSCLAFCDGYTVVPMPGAQDHKRALNGDKGLNTGMDIFDKGGMGCYAPAPVYTAELQALVKRTILQPTVDAMRRDGNNILTKAIHLLEFYTRESWSHLLDQKCSSTIADLVIQKRKFYSPFLTILAAWLKLCLLVQQVVWIQFP